MRNGMLLAGTFTTALLIGSLVSAPCHAAEPVETYAAQAPLEPVDPKLVIRAKAMARAKARATRMAAQAWYGYVPARPRAHATPLVGAGTIGRVTDYYARSYRPAFYRYR